ncbi:universal stress protein [Saccharopolyspora sp. NPDC050389]|uniref:universal stress protein n=1 Tax=Saccharopolyspora sp. NPDC050389 TaxID=3155516 RepID=UPI0033D6D3C1
MRKVDVVGVDGSQAAMEAVRWAAEDAALHRVPLRLVCAVPYGVNDAAAPSISQDTLEVIENERHRRLSQAVTTAAAVAGDVEITQEVRHAKPAAVLVEESTRARRVVVGTRGLGDATGVKLALGSTAETLAMRAACPVVVVPVRGGPKPAERSLPIIVGVDGSPVSEPALAVAFAEATVRRAPLTAVHVWSDDAIDEWFDLDADRDWGSIEAKEGMALAERLAGWQEEYPDVQVERVVERDRPVRFLVLRGARAQLIVVGSRGRGGVTGMMLGSTSRALLHAAPCPVLVVRAETG